MIECIGEVDFSVGGNRQVVEPVEGCGRCVAAVAAVAVLTKFSGEVGELAGGGEFEDAVAAVGDEVEGAVGVVFGGEGVVDGLVWGGFDQGGDFERLGQSWRE